METTSYLLSWIIFSPLLFALVAFLTPSAFEGKLRTITLIQTLVGAVLATVLYCNFDGNLPVAQMTHAVPWLPEWGINYLVSIDGISLPLVMLTAYVAPVAILGTWPAEGLELKKEKFFVMMLMFLQTGMYGTFLASALAALGIPTALGSERRPYRLHRRRPRHHGRQAGRKRFAHPE